MKTFTVDLWEGFTYAGVGPDGFRPTLDCYLLKGGAPRPAVLILPGSGYFQCSPREAEDFAVRFNAEGYHAFVLWYSCAPRRHPVPILDCSRAFTIIRSHAAEWVIDPSKIALMGFSAGGHLALSQTLYYAKSFADSPGIDVSECRPDALILCYPVVSSGEFAHRGSFDCLLGENPDAGLLALHSLEKNISKDIPPVFLWHTWSDDAVPVENTLLLADALRRAGVVFEMHIFPDGRHGLSLATEATAEGDPLSINRHAAQWFPLCINWVKKTLGIFGAIA